MTHRAWSVEAAVTAGGCCDHPRLLSPAVTSCHTTTSTDWREEFLQLCRYEVLNKIIILPLMRSSNGLTQFHRTLQALAMITQPSHPSSSLCRLMQLSKVVMWENSGMHHYYCQELLHIKLTLSTTLLIFWRMLLLTNNLHSGWVQSFSARWWEVMWGGSRKGWMQ